MLLFLVFTRSDRFQHISILQHPDVDAPYLRVTGVTRSGAELARRGRPSRAVRTLARAVGDSGAANDGPAEEIVTVSQRAKHAAFYSVLSSCDLGVGFWPGWGERERGGDTELEAAEHETNLL